MTVGIEASRQRLNKKLLKWGATSIQPLLDFASGTAIVNFTYKKQNYSFRYTKKNATEALSELSWSINRLVDCDIREILPFEKTGKEYLRLTGTINNDFNETQPDSELFLKLDLTPEASNEEIKIKFKKLAGMYHPDRAMNDEDRKLYEQKMIELNQAFQELKKIRGIE